MRNFVVIALILLVKQCCSSGVPLSRSTPGEESECEKVYRMNQDCLANPSYSSSNNDDVNQLNSTMIDEKLQAIATKLESFEDPVTWYRAIEAKLERLEDLVTWYKASNGYLYKVSTDKVNFNHAKTNCEKYGARLATAGFRDPNVTEELVKLIKARGHTTYIGLRDEQMDGVYSWIDGHPLMEGGINWQRHQPDNTGQHCVACAKHYQWKFDNVFCHSHFYYLCEKSV